MKYTSKAQLIKALKDQIYTRDDAACKALITIYNQQTEAEQYSYATKEFNRVGFSGIDAKFASKLAENYMQYKRLTERQLNCVKRIMWKYAGQLIEKSIAEGKIRKEKGVYVW